MNKICLQAPFMLLVCFTSWAGAQQSDVTRSEQNELVREKYDQSPDLPSGTAFSHMLGVLESVNQDAAIRMIQKGLELEPEAAVAFLDQLMDASIKLTDATAAAQNDLGCLDGAPKVHGKNTYDVLEAMDDIAQIKADEFFAIFLDEIGPQMAQKISKWIDNEKLNITYVEHNQKKLHEKVGANGDLTLASICDSLRHAPKPEAP